MALRFTAFGGPARFVFFFTARKRRVTRFSDYSERNARPLLQLHPWAHTHSRMHACIMMLHSPGGGGRATKGRIFPPPPLHPPHPSITPSRPPPPPLCWQQESSRGFPLLFESTNTTLRGKKRERERERGEGGGRERERGKEREERERENGVEW